MSGSIMGVPDLKIGAFRGGGGLLAGSGAAGTSTRVLLKWYRVEGGVRGGLAGAGPLP